MDRNEWYGVFFYARRCALACCGISFFFAFMAGSSIFMGSPGAGYMHGLVAAVSYGVATMAALQAAICFSLWWLFHTIMQMMELEPESEEEADAAQ